MIFCCSENENSSFLASALDCYRIRIPPSFDKKEIHHHLRAQFRMPGRAEKDEFLNAAEVDCEGWV